MLSLMKCVEVKTDTYLKPEIVWKSWIETNPWNHHGTDQSEDHFLQPGRKGHILSKSGKSIRYQILDVRENESFTVVWKALFVRLVFLYMVKPSHKGSLISYRVNIQGFFSWPIRLLLKKSLKKMITKGLNDFVKNLEASKEGKKWLKQKAASNV